MFYLGFLKQNIKDVVIFRAIKTPRQEDFRYFTGVMGPYSSEKEARKSLSAMRGQGYRENPAVSERQRKFMCAELGRLRSGKKIVTGMREDQLRDFCRKKNAMIMSPEKALRLTRKVIKYAIDLRKDYQDNLGQAYYEQKFSTYMRQLEKYKIGSELYVITLSKAFEHLESARESGKKA